MNNDAKAMWNQAASRYQDTLHEEDGGYPEELMKFLESRSAVEAGSRVADIGCGVGKYALRFARRGCGLLLLDIADNMMDYTRQNLASSSVPIETAICDWAETELADKGWIKSVDLAFAAMTPAIESGEDMEKLCAMSRKYCFVSKFAGMKNLLQHAAARACGLEPPVSRMSPEQSLSLQRWLLAAGYLPEVLYVPYGWENSYTPAQAAESILRGDLGEAVREAGREAQLLEALEAMADKDGLVHEVVETTVAWLFWHVNRC